MNKKKLGAALLLTGMFGTTASVTRVNIILQQQADLDLVQEESMYEKGFYEAQREAMRTKYALINHLEGKGFLFDDRERYLKEMGKTHDLCEKLQTALKEVAYMKTPQMCERVRQRQESIHWTFIYEGLCLVSIAAYRVGHSLYKRKEEES